MNLAEAAALTVAFMAAQDVFGVSLVIAEARNLAWWPGALDAAGDWVSRAGAALAAGAYVRHGLWSWDTQALLAATMATSFATTNTVTPLASRLLPTTRTGVGRRQRGGLRHLLDRIEALEAHTGLQEMQPNP